MSALGSTSVLSPEVSGVAVAAAGSDCPGVALKSAGSALAEGEFELESA